MNKSILSSMTAAGLLSFATLASAANITFTFQPCGNNTCAITNVGTLDWAPGNVVALGGAGGGTILPAGTKILDYYQANLKGTLGGSSTFSQGDSGYFFTIVAGFAEEVLGFPFSSGVTNAFKFDPTNPVNFFKVYANGTGGTDLTGAGFASGTAILEGKITAVQSAVSATLASVDPTTGQIIAVGPFDGYLSNDYPNTTSIGVTGSADVWAQITKIDANYFPDLALGDLIVAAFTTGNLLSPFATVDPSGAFSSDGVNSANFAPNIGAVNGLERGGDFQFQADTSTVFSRAVPEPGSLALLGMALVGVAGAIRRRRSA